MSHQVSLNLQIKNLSLLKRAVETNGWSFHENKTSAKAWGSNVQTCNHVISIPDERYDIAVIDNKDSTFTFNMESYVKNKYQKQLQESYVTEVAKEVSRKQGYRLNQQRSTDGTLVLELLRN